MVVICYLSLSPAHTHTHKLYLCCTSYCPGFMYDIIISFSLSLAFSHSCFISVCPLSVYFYVCLSCPLFIFVNTFVLYCFRVGKVLSNKRNRGAWPYWAHVWSRFPETAHNDFLAGAQNRKKAGRPCERTRRSKSVRHPIAEEVLRFVFLRTCSRGAGALMPRRGPRSAAAEPPTQHQR